MLLARAVRGVAAAASVASTRTRAEGGAEDPVDATPTRRNHYDHVIVGCGVGGTAALKAVSTRAPPQTSLLVVDSDPAAVARCRALARCAQSSVSCLRDRVASLHPGQQTLKTSAGDITYGRCLLASGSPAPAPPPGFVDHAARAAVRVLGLGETHDASAAATSSCWAGQGARRRSSPTSALHHGRRTPRPTASPRQVPRLHSSFRKRRRWALDSRKRLVDASRGGSRNAAPRFWR